MTSAFKLQKNTTELSELKIYKHRIMTWIRYRCESGIAIFAQKITHTTGSRSTFEFPSRVNLFSPSLYCIARTLGILSRHSIGLAGATRLTRSDFRLNLLLRKDQGCVIQIITFSLYTKTFHVSFFYPTKKCFPSVMNFSYVAKVPNVNHRYKVKA